MPLRVECRFACFQSCHAALSLPLVRCCYSVRLRAACFDCPVPCDLPQFPGRPFLIKAFQRIRCPAVLSIAMSWRLRFPIISLIISAGGVACLTCRCSPRLVVSLPAWSSFRPSARRHLIAVLVSSRLVSSSNFPGSLLAWLVGSAPSVISLIISDNLLACRPASRLASRPASRFSPRLSSRPSSRSPLGDVIAALPNRSPCRSALRSSIAQPCLSDGWERDGTGSPSSSSFVRLAAVACSGGCLGCVRFLITVCSACLGAAICVCIVLAKLYI